MKHVLINLANNQTGIYHTKTDICKIVGLSTKSLYRKGLIDQVIRYKGYIICLNVPEYQAISKQRLTSF